jgi:hypothetical protein
MSGGAAPAAPPLVSKADIAAKMRELAATDEGRGVLALLAWIGRQAEREAAL